MNKFLSEDSCNSKTVAALAALYESVIGGADAGAPDTRGELFNMLVDDNYNGPCSSREVTVTRIPFNKAKSLGLFTHGEKELDSERGDYVVGDPAYGSTKGYMDIWGWSAFLITWNNEKVYATVCSENGDINFKESSIYPVAPDGITPIVSDAEPASYMLGEFDSIHNAAREALSDGY